MHLPPCLPRNRAPLVHIVAPSGRVEPHLDRLRTGIESLESHGFKTTLGKDLSHRNYRGYLAGTDAERSEELLGALSDPRVDIVWWARGGSGAARIQNEIISKLKHAQPKWMIGFSDATSLLNALSIELGWVTLHGPTVTLLGCQKNWNSALRRITDRLTGVELDELGQGTLPPRVYGGNITVLASAMGTLNLDALQKHVLLLEDVNEHPYRLDRALNQIRQCWPLSMIQEIWLGDLDLDEDTSEEVAQYIEADFGCAVRRGVDAGHRGQLSFIPLGYSGDVE